MSTSATPPPDDNAAQANKRFWEDGRGPENGDEFSILGAMTIAVSARNAVEGLHATGAFSDMQAPAFNRRLRNHAYEVLLAAQLLAETGYDDQLADFLAEQASRDGQTDDKVEPLSALRGAIREAVGDFAKAEQLPEPIAKVLEATAVAGATDAFESLQSLNKQESAHEISYLAGLIPGYWELPEVTPKRRELFGLSATGV